MPPNGVDEDDDFPVMSLRQRLRADIHKVFRPHKVTYPTADAEVLKVGVKPPSSFKPPPRVVSGASPAEGSSVPAVAPKKKVACQDQGTQVEMEPISEKAMEVLRLAPEMGETPPEPRPLSQMPSRPKLVQKEGAAAAHLREDVAASRKKLLEWDGEVTGLKHQLRVFEKSNWDHQKTLSKSERLIAKLLDSHSDLDEQELIDREHKLIMDVAEARKQACRWSTLAQRQDEQLQQELQERRGPAQLSMHEIFAKHAAGDIFLPAPSVSDDESDFDDGPPRPWGSRGPADGMLSSDEEDEFLPGMGSVSRPTNGRGDSEPPPPPPPPRQQWPPRLGDDADEVSDGSSIPSPSEGSGSNATTPLGSSHGTQSASGTPSDKLKRASAGLSEGSDSDSGEDV